MFCKSIFAVTIQLLTIAYHIANAKCMNSYVTPFLKLPDHAIRESIVGRALFQANEHDADRSCSHPGDVRGLQCTEL